MAWNFLPFMFHYHFYYSRSGVLRIIFLMKRLCMSFVRDAIVINFVSFGTSLYAGIAVFSIIGFMAHEQRMPIEKVINSGMF